MTVFKLARISNKRLGCPAAGKKRLSGRVQKNAVRRNAAAWRFPPPGAREKSLRPKAAGVWMYPPPKTKVLHNHDSRGRTLAWGLLGLQSWPPPQLEDELLKKVGGVMSWACIPIGGAALGIQIRDDIPVVSSKIVKQKIKIGILMAMSCLLTSWYLWPKHIQNITPSDP